MGKYDDLSRDELIKLLQERDSDRGTVAPPAAYYDERKIKKIISDVLMLLFSSEEKESIDKALHLLMDFFDADWVYVATLDKESKTANFLYEVTSRWVHTSKEDASELTSDTIPWMIDTILDGKDIVLADIDHLPPEAHVDRALLASQELLSMLVIPIIYNGEVSGLIGFDSMRVRRHWTPAEVQNLHIIASIFSIIIERAQIRNTIESSRLQEEMLEVKLREAEMESHRAEMEKLKAQEADKLKSAFLANMSHEIRTPLNAIVGFSALMLETDDREEQQRFFDIISKNNDLLLGLISDILDFSKIESGKLDYTFSDVNLKEVCAQLYEVHSLKAQPGVTMAFEREKLPPVTLHTDAKRVTQVISNLLSNALKFTARGTITLSYELRGDQVYVEVVDTGIGIPPSFRESIFQRFVKVDEFMQGTGLGLPISKTIIETLHGTMGVKSEEGKGSVFWFTLPLQGPKTEGTEH